MKNIYGIAGTKGSGKDTVAKMLYWIKSRGTYANFYNFIDNINKINIDYKLVTTHFADPLKDVMSIIFNIPRDLLDSREKDTTLYSLTQKRIVHKDEIPKNSNLIDYFDLVHKNISSFNSKNSKEENIVTIRLLMQYIATDIFRCLIDENVWVRATTHKINDILFQHNYCIVADVRFANEAEMIKRNGGKIILVNRFLNNNDSHESEIIDFDVDTTIDNSGTMFQTFYQLFKI